MSAPRRARASAGGRGSTRSRSARTRPAPRAHEPRCISRHRLDVHEQPAAPGDVRRHRGDEIDHADDRRHEGGEAGTSSSCRNGRSLGGRRWSPSRQAAMSRRLRVRSGQSFATSQSADQRRSRAKERSPSARDVPAAAAATNTSTPRCHSWIRRPEHGRAARADAARPSASVIRLRIDPRGASVTTRIALSAPVLRCPCTGVMQELAHNERS